MKQLHDKYGRGSTEANGAEFVDLESGDTFSGLEVEAIEIKEDADSERTPRGETAPLQNQVSQLASRIAYYVGDVNRTKPTFLARSKTFRAETAAELIMGMVDSLECKYDGKELSDLLTIVIPVKNEEKNLPACLENVKDFTSVVLVDSGSTDKTREIFEGFREKVSGFKFQVSGGRESVSGDRFQGGWEIVDFKWDGKFPKKRNWVLRNYKFRTPWVLFLDADERVTEAWKKEAAKVLGVEDGEAPRSEDAAGTVGADRYDVIKCYYDNWFMGKMLRHGDCMQKTAMVRVGAAEYEKIDEDNWSSLDMEIHEHLQIKDAGGRFQVSGSKSQVEGREGEIVARLEHHDKRSFESHVAKHREYAKWESNRYRQLMAHPERWEALTPRQKVKYRNLTKWWLAPAYFAVCYFRKLGFLDGYAGLRFALFKAWYFALVRREIRKS